VACKLNFVSKRLGSIYDRGRSPKNPKAPAVTREAEGEPVQWPRMATHPTPPNDHEPLPALNPRADPVSYSPVVHEIKPCAKLEYAQGREGDRRRSLSGLISSYSGYQSSAL